ncbi:MAG: pentapeptide repeat-containing protein [Bacteroidetes bacterium]|nr:pentapeptide repeat-containing protein [Fibrella sp.]
MKILSLLVIALLSNPALLAQNTVEARDIIAKIDRNEPVSYQGVTILGTLDLTELANKRSVREGQQNDSYRSTVKVPVTFVNCTFKGDVIAYKSIPDGKRIWENTTVYSADFDESVRFEACEFTGESAFKYSAFRETALFTKNRFREEALFKYAKFAGSADFTGSTFAGYANFKYTNFREGSGFRQTTFTNYADFKYAEFSEGVDFSDARFGKIADFKYVRFPRGTNFASARFDGDTDFKYATMQGRKFAPER